MKIAGLLLAGLLILFTGCRGAMPDSNRYSRLSLGSVDYKRAFDVSRDMMRNEFGQIQPDRDSATIKASPSYFSEEGLSLTPRQYRRTAHLKLEKHQKQWWAYLRVQIERRDTRTYQQFGGRTNNRDYRYSTPMEAGETAPWEKKQVWTKIRRENDREKRILHQIRRETIARH